MLPCKFGFTPRIATPHFMATLALCLSGSIAFNAHATLLGDSVTATLSSPLGIIGNSADPTPINVSDTVTVGAGSEITPGVGNVGFYMLDSEYIDFQGGAISLRAQCGATTSQGVCITGYGSGAKYIFSDLNDSLGVITGFNLLSSHFLNFNSNWVSLIDAHTISVALDTMQLEDQGNGESNNFGLLTINLVVRPGTQPPGNDVPEPGSLPLSLAAALALACTARRRRF